jgi:hypothetical protein
MPPNYLLALRVRATGFSGVLCREMPTPEHPRKPGNWRRSSTSADIPGKVAALGANIPSRAYSDQAAIDAFLATFDGQSEQPGLDLNCLNYGVAEAPLWAGDCHN